MEEHISPVERVGMLLIGALVVIAMPVLGLLVTVTGSMSAMVSYTTGDGAGHALTTGAIPDGATVTAAPVVEPNLRAIILSVALVLLGFLAIYRLLSVSGSKPVVSSQTVD
ncbi:hypothetical protein [Halanaeroarchaeum sulfurireducens]|uniref:Cox cluster protein n=1 Tax=Halanaeroarchaeum sulfurireducens TaxID=1604004 RepID=A0A0F7PAC3_9EURY|nr:hypothetical protein [Halanaeroarchaeum sulfurireducens]AKH98111.1 hypothetical protein HLASF_1635 [Halanaeroarchaeum sulfurireducens]ALG82505.1 hypothetical protein HLASA_1622 [Halanaeroarchaeum sulfurireducens]